MKKHFASLTIAPLLLLAGCASSDRMLRLSGDVLDEYAPPPRVRLRAKRYQDFPGRLASPERANSAELAGTDDAVINLWPFFFRSAREADMLTSRGVLTFTDSYWTILWPLIDCDPYGFAFRPFYNHEGDEYSILFPLAAWNNTAGHGWVGTFGWLGNDYGMLPFFWRWRDVTQDGLFCAPFFLFDRDRSPLVWGVPGGITRRERTDRRFRGGLLFDRHRTSVAEGEWAWLFRSTVSYANLKNEWLHRFRGERPYPANEADFERFRRETFAALPRREERTHALLPLWWGTMADDGDCFHRFLLLAGYERDRNRFAWDFLGKLGAEYQTRARLPDNRFLKGETRFTALLLLSYFHTEHHFRKTDSWQKLDALYRLSRGRASFARRRPAFLDALAELDPALKLPETVVDDTTFRLYLDELRQQYDFPVDTEYTGCVAPLFWYNLAPESDRWVLPALLTWWRRGETSSGFYSVPLLTFLSQSPAEDWATVLSPLVYYAKTVRRERRDYRVFKREKMTAPESNCTELRDRYALCGLFYRGRFGFNVVKEPYNAETVEKLRTHLHELPRRRSRLDDRAREIAKKVDQNDRWQTRTEIERLKKLIRYEELKIDREKLDRDIEAWQGEAAEARALAAELDFPLAPDAPTEPKAAERAADALLAHATELRYYEDIGNRIVYHRENLSNGDYRWRLLGILAGGEKRGERESTHILHLLYRSRREGKRVEKVYFPFITVTEEGEDGGFSFLYRVFSLTRRGGKRSGHIFFIPFGDR